MKRTTALLAGIALTTTLSACGGGAEETPTLERTDVTAVGDYAEASTITYPLKDGREVTCILYSYDRSGAPDCDWATAAPAEEVSPLKGKTVAVSDYGTVGEIEQKLEDGRTVTCVVYNYDRGGASSCDWDSATER